MMWLANPQRHGKQARHLVVSIHDVSPLTHQSVAQILAALAGVGVEQTSLLVIPNHHRRGRMCDDPAFCAWLQAQANAGHEVVVHGYYHLRSRKPGETLHTKILTRFYTQDEGEFYDLAENEAFELARQGQNEMRSLGIEPAGFIAPAWLLSSPAEHALTHLGFAYTTRLSTVKHLRSGRSHWSPSLVWSVHNAWRRQGSLFWNHALFLCLQSNSLLRIGLHPPDLKHSSIWRQIQRLTARAAAVRQPVTYAKWCAAFFQG